MFHRLVIAVLLACCATLPAAADLDTDEYRVKAVLLSKLIDFVYWPQEERSRYELCVIGEDPFGEHLEAAFKDKDTVSLVRVRMDEASAGGCDVAYISASQQRSYVELIRTMENMPVLTVSDIPRFAVNGGMINLDLVNRRVRFRINQEEIEKSGLSVSYKLLRLADLVQTESAG